MQYENIILELMTRIQKLEEEVKMLKQWQSEIEDIRSGEVNNADNAEPESSASSYQKMTDEMIDMCYEYGKEAATGKSIQELAGKISSETGMNRNSAIMYLYAIYGMLTGKIYKRAISAKAMKKYYDKILSEFGSTGLKKAIDSTRLHIEYRRQCGQKVDSIEKMCDNYENRQDSRR